MRAIGEIIKEIAKDMNLNEGLVQEVIKSQFEFTRDTIKDGKFKGVMLAHLGKFAVKPGRLDHLNKHKNDN